MKENELKKITKTNANDTTLISNNYSQWEGQTSNYHLISQFPFISANFGAILRTSGRERSERVIQFHFFKWFLRKDSQLDTVEFAGFRSVIRGRAVKNAGGLLPEMDEDGDGVSSLKGHFLLIGRIQR